MPPTPGSTGVPPVTGSPVPVCGTATELDLNAIPPVVILMVGLQGSGKTTSSAKIAYRLSLTEVHLAIHKSTHGVLTRIGHASTFFQQELQYTLLYVSRTVTSNLNGVFTGLKQTGERQK